MDCKKYDARRCKRIDVLGGNEDEQREIAFKGRFI